MAKISPKLQKVVGSIQTSQKASAAAAVGGGARPWMNFADVQKAGKFDSSGITAIFDRNDTNSEYSKLRTNKDALAKEIQAVKTGGDMLAGMERDTRARRRSRIRMFAHVSARAKANGDAAGPVATNSIGLIVRILSESKG